jgi:diadenosine tetraphosphatase ApaH/serine/threonine PP2A family protein phosphatase
VTYGDTALWMKCMDTFGLLPVAALIDRRVMSLHGRFSSHFALVQDLLMTNCRKEILEQGLLADLTWSDHEEANITFPPTARRLTRSSARPDSGALSRQRTRLHHAIPSAR